ncbi:MAG: hybrid sensor histidine kinase/response regulator [Balneolaceae bacterium]|nr:MAG: hybrid sensor histidine kinase/response regulator [Balneolaceae bacterium]
MSRNIISFFILLVCVPVSVLFAQIHPEAGRFYFQQFPPEVHGAHNQSWALLEDENGIMYIGNGNGLIEYDGVEWSLIEVAGGQVALSLEFGANNRIFVGSVNDFGEIKTDSLGRPAYVSFTEKVAEENREFEDVWETVVTSDGAFFRTRSAIFHLDRDDSLHTFIPEERFERIHTVEDEVYSVDLNVGLKRFNGSIFEFVPGGELFESRAIWFMNRQPDGSIFIATRDGTFSYDGDTFTLIELEITSVLEEMTIYNATEVPGTGYAYATTRGGVFLTDYDGNILRQFDDQMKLPTNQTTNILADRLNNLWVTTTNGLARIEIASPVTYFDRSLGLATVVEGIARHEGTLFTAQSSAISYLQPGENGNPARMVSIPVTTNNNRRLLHTEHGLLLSTSSGLLVVEKTGTTIVVPDLESATISRSDYDPDIILIGHLDGVAMVTYLDGAWTKIMDVEGVSEQAFSVVQDSDGIIWIGTDFQGLVRADISGDEPIVHRFNSQDYFNSGSSVNVGSAYGKALILTGTGIYRPSEPWSPENPFTPSPSEVDTDTEGLKGFSRLTKIDENKYWVSSNQGNGYITSLENQPDSIYAGALARVPSIGTQFIYPEENGIVWIASADGLARFDSNIAYPEGIEFNALVREVSNSETLIFGGNRGLPFISEPLSYQNNALRFRFGSNFYDDVGSTMYQVRLLGFDSDWSGWSSETFRDYTNLPHGNFVMQVRAMNTYGHISNIGEYSFTILPPWWHTWWAYSIYFLLIAGFLYGVDRYRLRNLRKREAYLEDVVNKRTEELREEKKITEAQAEKLKQLDAEKSRFFANISHEFRTPLTLTIAPLENLQKEKYGVLTEAGKAQVDMATRNAKRLMRLVAQLLDLARFEANLFKLKPETAELNQYLRYLTSRFVGAAERYNIRFDVNIPGDTIAASFDPEQFEKVISNLLSNAFKFTPDGGTITFTLARGEGNAVITVKDTGQGISPEHLPRLFDRFYQAEKSEMQPGTGIGLALVKEITEQHSGIISVESKPGEGAIFTVMIPLAEAETGNLSELTLDDSDAGLEEFLIPDKPTPLEDEEMMLEDEDDDRKTLLVVDDNMDIRSYLRDHFSEDYRVIEAASGNRALEKIQKSPPDIIISDIMMPDGDGFSLLKDLRANPETDFLPIILLTARAEAEDKLEGLGIGADDYLTKPFSMEEVTIRVHNLIERQKRLQKHYEHQGGHVAEGSGKKRIHPDSVDAESANEIYLEQVRQIIQENMHDENFSVEDLADKMFQSRTHLFRRLKELTGETPSALIKRMRLERGADLLKQNMGTVSEIAYSTGFKSVAQFSRSFRDQFSQTPTEYLSAA